MAVKFNFQEQYVEIIILHYYTSEHCYTEVKEFPSNNTQKCSTSRYCYSKVEVSLLFVSLLPGMVTWKLINHGVTILKNLGTSEYCYPEVGKCPGIDTWISTIDIFTNNTVPENYSIAGYSVLKIP